MLSLLNIYKYSPDAVQPKIYCLMIKCKTCEKTELSFLAKLKLFDTTILQSILKFIASIPKYLINKLFNEFNLITY